MPVEALNTAVPRYDDCDRFAMGIDKRSGHGLFADRKFSRHEDERLHRYSRPTDELPNALGRHEKLRGKGICLALDTLPPILAAGVEQVQIAERAMPLPIGEGLVRFDEEVSQLVGNRESPP